MTAAEKLNLISVEDYLAGELVSRVKHEYLGGVVYAMAGARNVHNVIATNVLGSLHARLRGRDLHDHGEGYGRIRQQRHRHGRSEGAAFPRKEAEEVRSYFEGHPPNPRSPFDEQV